MSFPQRRTNSFVRRPAQIFKKRHSLDNITVPSNSNGTLLAEIQLTETGTVYAVKVSAKGIHVAGVSGDSQLIRLWVRCVPFATALPDLTAVGQLDTMNGFYVGSLYFSNGNNAGPDLAMTEKFRFRRKCDEDTLIQLIAQSFNYAGNGRSVEMVTTFVAINRVR